MAAVIIVGTNSWCTIVESNAYLEEKWNANTWTTLTDAQKTQLLITAYRWVNGDDRFSIAVNSTNNNVKNAQIETAWYIYNNNDEIEKRISLQQQGVVSFGLSKFSENYSKGYRIPDIAATFLDGFESYVMTTEIIRTLD